jgi:hypothetical protein
VKSKLDILIDQALALGPDDRAALATALLDSIAGANNATVNLDWADEIRLRKIQLRSGIARPVPWPQARARLSAL